MRRLARILPQTPTELLKNPLPDPEPEVILSFSAPEPSEPAPAESPAVPPPDGLREERRLLEQELETLRRNLDSFRTESEEERRRIREASAQDQARLDRVRSELGEADRQLALRQESSRHLEQSLESLRARREDSQLRLQEVEVALTEGYERHTALRAELATSEQSKTAAIAEGERIRKEAEREVLRKAEADRATVIKELEPLRAELGSLQTNLKTAGAEHAALQDKIGQLRQEAETAQVTVSQVREAVSAAEQDLRAQTAEIEQYHALVEELRRERERGRAEVTEAESRLSQIAETVASLQRKERSLVDYVQMLNRQKHQLERELQKQGSEGGN